MDNPVEHHQHKRERNERYGSHHKHERERWMRLLRAGGLACTRCGRMLSSTDEVHLDHSDDGSPTSYNGMSHASCNIAANAPKRRKRRRPIVDDDSSGVTYVSQDGRHFYVWSQKWLDAAIPIAEWRARYNIPDEEGI